MPPKRNAEAPPPSAVELLNGYFLSLGPGEASGLHRRLRRSCAHRGLVFDYGRGRPEPVPLMVRPRLLTLEQRGALHSIAWQVLQGLRTVPRLFQESSRVRALLPLEDREGRWLQQILRGPAGERPTYLGRLDALVSEGEPDWRESLAFVEPNVVGMGIRFCPLSEEVLQRIVLPGIEARHLDLTLQTNNDLRELLLLEIREHARRVGIRGRLRIAFLDDSAPTGAISEFRYLVDYYVRHGVEACLAHPRDVRLRKGVILAGGTEVDLLYRFQDLRDLLALEREGGKLDVWRHAFRTNRVIPTAHGELDHKSTFEVLTNPRYAAHFKPAAWRLFQRHVLWTRMLGARTTTSSRGRSVDLPEYVRRRKDELVIKPNRKFGGEGVLIGRTLDITHWEEAIDRAVAEPGGWVVQRYRDPDIVRFPVLGREGYGLRSFYSVCGFFPTSRGLGVFGRVSRSPVVNIARGGALTAFLVHVT